MFTRGVTHMRFKRMFLSLLVVMVLCCSAVFVHAAVDAPGIAGTNEASSGKIQLTWDAVDGAACYEIYRSPGESETYILLDTLYDTTYVDSDAVAGEQYDYYVIAVDGDGVQSPASNTVSCVCDLPQPEITSIRNVSATGEITFDWSTVDGASAYTVYRATSKSGTYTELETTTETSWIDDSANPGTRYYYKVRAIHTTTAANSAYSAIKTRTCDLAQPVVTAKNVASSGRVRLTWDAIEDAVEYKVYRATSKNGKYSLMKTTTGTSYTNTNATAEKYYYYKVRAICSNTDAHSAYSEIVGRTCDLPRPTVSGYLNSNGKPRLTWEAVDGAVKYEVYRATSKNGTYSRMKTTTGTSYTNTNFDTEKTYYYTVRAIASKSAANSAYSSVVSLKTTEYQIRYVSRHQIYVYDEPTSSSDSTTLPYMAKFELGKPVHEYSSGIWYKIRYQGSIYYLWLEDGDEKFTATESSYDYKSDNPYAQQAIDLAKEIRFEWDTHYVSGDSTGIPDSSGRYGFDCSGFVTYCINTVMQQYNPAYRLIGNTQTLYYDMDVVYNGGYTGEYCAEDINLSNIEPADLIFFAMSDSGMNHVGIYLGNGEFAHIGSPWNVVTIMPLEGAFEERVVGVRRFIPDKVTAANKTMYSSAGRCKLYAERNDESEVLYTFAKNEKMKLLFTNAAGNWAYVQNSDGSESGFVLTKFISDTKS